MYDNYNTYYTIANDNESLIWNDGEKYNLPDVA